MTGRSAIQQPQALPLYQAVAVAFEVLALFDDRITDGTPVQATRDQVRGAHGSDRLDQDAWA